MDTKELIKQKAGRYFENDLIEYLDKVSLINPVVKGQHIIQRDKPFEYIVLVLSGITKVLRTDDKGNEHILFYLKEGDSCAATYGICEESFYDIQVDMFAETDGIIMLIPKANMDELLARFPDWRKYVLKNLRIRTSEYLHTLDMITFQKLDERLYNYLKEKADALGTKEIEITHQEIAQELATSRVVISRLLKMLERDGKIKLFRNRIVLQ